MDLDLDLAQLFALADAIGDKYLTAAEIEARDAELLAIAAAIEAATE